MKEWNGLSKSSNSGTTDQPVSLYCMYALRVEDSWITLMALKYKTIGIYVFLHNPSQKTNFVVSKLPT